MDPVLKKLQVKDHDRLLVVAAPPELAELIDSWRADLPIAARQRTGEQAALVFVRSCADIEARVPAIVPRMADDCLLWFAYPKKSSKRYTSDVGRDDSWAAMGSLGFEPVRQVAIDADWSALRFRRATDIRTLTRDPAMALSEAGRRRARSAR